jgi:hypothetical protein
VRERKLNLAKHALWRERLLAWEQSGLSAPEFCRLNDFNVHTFRFWQRQILKSENTDSRNSPERPKKYVRAKRAPVAKKAKPVSFAQVSIAENANVHVVGKEIDLQEAKFLRVEIATPTGFLVRVAIGADVASLAMVLRATEQLSC